MRRFRNATVLTLFSILSLTAVAEEPSADLEGLSLDSVPLENVSEPSPLSEAALEAIRQVEREIQEADRDLRQAQSSEAEKSKTPRIPIETNEQVRKWIHYFTVKDRARFQRFLDRGAVYRTLIKKELRENGVPADLYYLAMIESGFTLHAKSHAGAVGAWQFIPGTGRRYGLMQNSYVDERREIVHSTRAAAKYLKNLHMAFQSWYLAMAGYNAGEGRILGAILRGGTRDFWELVEKKALPSETRNYVPKFLAAVIIGKNPSRYGFRITGTPDETSRELVEIPGRVKLSAVAQASGVPLAVLKRLNPHLLRGMTPPAKDGYSIWVPARQAEKVSSIRTALLKKRVRETRTAKFYRVRRGDVLVRIAQKHRVSVSHLKRINDLRGSKIHVGQMLRIASSR